MTLAQPATGFRGAKSPAVQNAPPNPYRRAVSGGTSRNHH